MEFGLTRMSSKGQVVIPAEVRKRLGLRPGAKFALFTDGQNLLLQKLAEPDRAGFQRLMASAAKTKAKAGQTLAI